jgi:hypothetical protein
VLGFNVLKASAYGTTLAFVHMHVYAGVSECRASLPRRGQYLGMWITWLSVLGFRGVELLCPTGEGLWEGKQTVVARVDVPVGVHPPVYFHLRMCVFGMQNDFTPEEEEEIRREHEWAFQPSLPHCIISASAGQHGS